MRGSIFNPFSGASHHLLIKLIVLFAVPAVAAAAPRVVVSIKPIHALTAAVMDGAGEPVRLIDDGQSPHEFVLKPSTARLIEDADLIVWVGRSLESGLASSIESLGREGRSLAVLEAGLPVLLPIRRDGVSVRHAHAGRDSIDPHVWLDPSNASAIAERLAERLAALDPDAASTYRSNAEKLAKKIDTADKAIAERLAPLTQRRYISLHDSFQYFEHHYAMESAGTLVADSHNNAGAQHLVALRRVLAEKDIACVVYEPLSPRDLLEVLLEGRSTPSVATDPLGRDAGDDYPSILQAVAAGFERCLSGSESPM